MCRNYNNPWTQDVIRKKRERGFWGTGNVLFLDLRAGSVC